MSDEPRARFSLEDLREGFLVDYGMRTWELRTGDDIRLLEYEREDGGTFRLSRRIRPADITSERAARWSPRV